MQKAEFIALQRAALREESHFSIVWLVFFFAALIGNVFLAQWIDHHRPVPWLRISYGCLLFGFLFGNFGLLIWSMKRRNRKFGLLCPGCGKPLTRITGQIATATGFCGHCGAAVFDQGTPTP